MASINSKNLNFILSLVDKLSTPWGKTMDKVQKDSNRSFDLMKNGFAGIYSGAKGIEGALAPAVNFNQELKQLKIAGTLKDDIAGLSKEAMRFSWTIGGSSDIFVKNAVVLKRTIADLTGKDLKAFASASSAAAIAWQTDNAIINDMLGQTSGMMAKEMAKVGGGDKWVEQFIGQIDVAQKRFKVLPAEFANAFKSLGNAGANSGMSSAQQIAVMGTAMDNGMDASQAGAQLKAMLNSSRMQGKDFSTELMKMMEKYGHMDEKKLRPLMRQMFGKGGDLAATVIKNGEGLKTGLEEITKVKGLGAVVNDAKEMQNPLNRMTEGFKGVWLVISMSLLPAFSALMGVIGDCGQWIGELLQKNQWLAFAIGFVVVAVSLFAMVAGIGTFAIGAFNFALLGAKMTLGMFKGALLLAKGIFWLFTTGAAIATKATWAFTIGLLACPVTWIVLGVIALIASLALLIIYWDDVKKYAGICWEWIKIGIGWVWDKLKAFGSFLMEVGIDTCDFLLSIGKMLLKPYLAVIDAAMWLLSKIPGIGGKIKDTYDGMRKTFDEFTVRGVVEARSGTNNDVAAGGVRSSTSNTTNWGGVTINASNGMSPGQLEEWAAMQT